MLGYRLISVFALMGSCVGAFADELVVNGGFETGNFTGWALDYAPNTLVAPSGYSYGGVVFDAHSGNFFAALGANVNTGDATFHQDIATSAGESYYVSFWLFSDGDLPNLLDVTFGSDTVYNVSDIPAEGWTEYSGIFTASSSSTALQFVSLDSPGYLALDDVSVTSGVPGPAALVPFLAGLGAVARRRRS